MTLYLIGLGLDNEHDISLKGFDILNTCTTIYYEEYTSRLHCTLDDLQTCYAKPITPLSRTELEHRIPAIVQEAQHNNIAVLIIGSPLSATTHMEFIIHARTHNVAYQVIEAGSIYSAVAITGLFLYKFGRTTTIPFANDNVTSPYDIYKDNAQRSLHTLFLLDITTDKLMTVREGLDYLINQGLDPNTLCVGCGALGSAQPEIKTGTAQHLTITSFPQSLIIPGKLNFKEEEALNLWT